MEINAAAKRAPNTNENDRFPCTVAENRPRWNYEQPFRKIPNRLCTELQLFPRLATVRNLRISTLPTEPEKRNSSAMHNAHRDTYLLARVYDHRRLFLLWKPCAINRAPTQTTENVGKWRSRLESWPARRRPSKFRLRAIRRKTRVTTDARKGERDVRPAKESGKV